LCKYKTVEDRAITEGIEQEKAEIARTSLIKGLDVEMISSITGLDISVIEKLASEDV